MKPARKKRLFFIIFLVTGITVAAGFALYAFNQNLMFYFSPAEVKQGKAPVNKVFRMGGMVVEGTFKKEKDTLKVFFDLTDYENTVTVEYTGLLPDLFREGQGIISRGKLNAEGVFVAEEVLAKHDENYMPPEVAESLKKNKK
ncbi:MAG: cytochrome c maturation protein CcmE [Gammaproteobacteria bacterium]|nr:cytochrome c maturation protein CcmE [Gammaproteobacteria bacterium]MCW8987937.1 cytochrome c maturation protein CcmE [Gammaproteobacteria bacterium]MCW9031027.1 cytochrome c maturation protein CcmE [Gammaproteobacteria bacterium]